MDALLGLVVEVLEFVQRGKAIDVQAVGQEDVGVSI